MIEVAVTRSEVHGHRRHLGMAGGAGALRCSVVSLLSTMSLMSAGAGWPAGNSRNRLTRPPDGPDRSHS